MNTNKVKKFSSNLWVPPSVWSWSFCSSEQNPQTSRLFLLLSFKSLLFTAMTERRRGGRWPAVTLHLSDITSCHFSTEFSSAHRLTLQLSVNRKKLFDYFSLIFQRKTLRSFRTNSAGTKTGFMDWEAKDTERRRCSLQRQLKNKHIYICLICLNGRKAY